MATCFCLTIRFLQPMCHGRGDGGDLEWPPSPLRAFQALCAAAAARWNERGQLARAAPALRWLERLTPPTVVAPLGTPSNTPYRLYVPDNVGDKVAASWVRGGRDSIANYRTEKDVRAMHLADGSAVCYVWPLPREDANCEQHRAVLTSAARSITHLGWGIDMVVAQASVLSEGEAAKLAGNRWLPGETGLGQGFRVPRNGTLDDLIRRHERFLNRMARRPDGSMTFLPPPPLTVFDTVPYRKESDMAPRAFAAFSLLKPDTTGFRAFDTVTQGLTVIGKLRAATRSAAESTGRRELVDRVILGHAEPMGAEHIPVGNNRFAYMPLPSLEARGSLAARVVGSVRRVLLASFGDDLNSEIGWAKRALSGRELIAEGTKKAIALISAIPSSDRVVRQYCPKNGATQWATVTPVVLPGYDDPKHYRRRLKAGVKPDEQKRLLAALKERSDGLLRKAILQAGYPEMLAKNARLEWSRTGVLAGTDLADRYGVPAHLKRYPRLHARIRWLDSDGSPLRVPGPVCIGGGRFLGLGLFAAEG